MAKKQQKEKSIEETLWESANKLRGSVEPSEYKVSRTVRIQICGIELDIPEIRLRPLCGTA